MQEVSGKRTIYVLMRTLLVQTLTEAAIPNRCFLSDLRVRLQFTSGFWRARTSDEVPRTDWCSTHRLEGLC